MVTLIDNKLKLHVDSQLPDFLGGDCRCPEEGGCLFAEKGPWRDPVIMQVHNYIDLNSLSILYLRGHLCICSSTKINPRI